MIEITEDQRHQLECGNAVNITDPKTARDYVVMRKDLYDRVRRLLYDATEWTDDELRQLLALSAKDNGWDEPGMEAYDRYDEERRTQCR